ncbi:hypothetical protein TIFTF001_044834 [Ficus carica]|uniref:Uncharacterized protein n=1 Tax=Ficus carica TaxID=3494 RepID=A0AA87ZFQ3_FICCA|nr:hypothetical protein TIFTF001_044834 [Ficus carica]
MAFWGIEVKSRKPFTHNFDDSKGRLHISMLRGTQVTMKTKCRYHSCLKGSVAANKVKQDEEENASTGNDEGDMQPARKSDVPVDNKLLASDVGQKDGGTPNKKRKVQSAKVDSNGLGLMAEDCRGQREAKDSE